jgi:quercetin dioxygenase-like cupin family protein
MGHVSTDEIIDWLAETDRDAYDVLVKESMTVSIHRYHPGSSTDRHDRVHEEDELYYVISGSGNVRIEDEVYSVSGGDTVFVDAGDWHTFVDIEETLVVLKVFPSKSASGDVHRDGPAFQ